ncbi:unnamed protein product [Urochloa humidicola]
MLSLLECKSALAVGSCRCCSCHGEEGDERGGGAGEEEEQGSGRRDVRELELPSRQGAPSGSEEKRSRRPAPRRARAGAAATPALQHLTVAIEEEEGEPPEGRERRPDPLLHRAGGRPTSDCPELRRRARE